MKQSTPTKRLVIVHGDKGGVGKSTFARLLADYYTQHAPEWHGYTISGSMTPTSLIEATIAA